MTPLRVAAAKGRRDVVSILIAVGASLDDYDEVWLFVTFRDRFVINNEIGAHCANLQSGCTAVIAAAANGYAHIVKRLIAMGADPCAADKVC